MTNKQAPIEVNRELIQRNLEGLVYQLAPQEPVEIEPNLLDGDADSLATRMAFYLAQKGTPKAPGDEVYGWMDSEKQFHVRVCPILRVTDVHEDQWDQFNDTFSPNTVQHGLTGRGACQCGYINGELRVQADLSEMMGELLRVGA